MKARFSKFSIFEIAMVAKKLVLYIFLFILISACRKENALDCFKSTGKTVVENRKPGFFRNVELNSKINVRIFQGNECNVEVIGGKNVISNISTRIEGDVLIIEDKNECNFVRGYKRHISINVTLPYAAKVINAGVAKITFAEDFTQDTLVVRATNSGDIDVNGTFKQLRTSSHGNGDITIKGRANSLFIYTNGTNFVHAEDFVVTDYIFVETLTIGDCTINATQLSRLEYNIHRSGNIYYIGQPGSIDDFSAPGVKGKAIQKD